MNDVEDGLNYGPADQEALERRKAQDASADYAMSATRRLSETFARRPVVADLAALEVAMREAGPNQAVEVAPELMDTILAQRNAIHGDFTDDAATAQALKYVMRQGKNWDDMPPYMREALDQMQTKVARILAGDYRHPDHWKDLQGYPRLVEVRL
jgi:hypothetical protein